MPRNLLDAAKYLVRQLGNQAPRASSRVSRYRTLSLEILESKTLLATNLVTNGGFETGNFSGWTLSGNEDGYTYVASASDDIEPPHSGNYAAMLGAIGANGNDNELSQTLTTVKGDIYQGDCAMIGDLGRLSHGDSGMGGFSSRPPRGRR